MHKNKKPVLGIILVIIGGFLLMDNFHLISYNVSDIIFSWYMILIVLGIIFMSGSDSSTGAVLIVVGGVFLVADVMNVSLGYLIRDFWPVILIAIGLYIIFKRGNRGNKDYYTHSYTEKDDDAGPGSDTKTDHRKHHHEFYGGEGSRLEDETDFVNEDGIFTSINKRIISSGFRGGKVSIVAGGVELDLRECRLAEGENYLDVSVIFGGMELMVPQNWKVVSHISPMFGGVDDQRVVGKDKLPGSTLIISGSVLFGGCEIKN